jgi:hypothetical protein
MMLRYAGKNELQADKLPHDTEMRARGIDDSEFALCEVRLGLRSCDTSVVSTPDALAAQLSEFGPLWCAGNYSPALFTNGGRDYKHIVVVRGVHTHWFGEAAVLVNDPYRGYIAQARPSWISWSLLGQPAEGAA